MIISKIFGGLGNQMFQYAVGRSLSLSSGQKLKLDVSTFKKYKLRDYGLEQFNIKAKLAWKLELPKKQKKFAAKALKPFLPASKCTVIKEETLRFDPNIPSLRSPVYLDGYWQSEKYFEKNRKIIHSDFKLVEDLTASRQPTCEQIKRSNIPISVHVRRGDYVSNPKAFAVHGTCEPAWYEAAIAQMIGMFGKDIDLFVFSDDPKWVRETFPPYLPEMHLVAPQGDGRDAQDIFLMASCHSHIIANSSFSWWGAWLNENPEKHIIAPNQWFKSQNHDATDIVPTTWQRL